MYDSIAAIQITQKLIAFAVFLQSIELIIIRNSYSSHGVWRWETLRSEFIIFSKFHQRILDFCLNYQNFLTLVVVRSSFSFILLFYSNTFILAVLLISTVLIALRWRGTFNGGSDYVTVLVLFSLTVGSAFNYSEKISLAILWYIAISIVSSYLIAGVVKLRKQRWRSGKALRSFIQSSIYFENRLSKLITNSKFITLVMSWIIMVFEASFIIIFVYPDLLPFYLGIAVLFHVGVFYLFGLNRFIFAWIACYPALYFVIQK